MTPELPNDLDQMVAAAAKALARETYTPAEVARLYEPSGSRAIREGYEKRARELLTAAGVLELLEERERLKADNEAGKLERTNDRAHDLRQRLNRSVRWLREAEDIARVEMPGWPTADRIRAIYEQITEDVLNGRTSVPALRERAEKAEAKVERLRWLLERASRYIGEHAPTEDLQHEVAALSGEQG